MPRRRFPLRKISEVLRLTAQWLSRRQVSPTADLVSGPPGLPPPVYPTLRDSGREEDRNSG